MGTSLKEKTYLITGATRGIGRSISKLLHEQGARVILTGRSPNLLETLSNELNSERCHTIASDLSTERGCLSLAATFKALDLSIDGLINNAGIGIFGPLEETSTQAWDMIMAINARAPFLLCREFLPLLKVRGRGHIINIASVVAHKGYPNQSAYAASKHALLGFSKSLAREVQADGIRVHVLCPGGVDTEMVSDSRPDLDRDVLMSPEEIAETTLFLLTRKGNAVIDQIDLRRESSTPWA
jgi:3-oxoacyl-[acyl-carrier protein] reductase